MCASLVHPTQRAACAASVPDTPKPFLPPRPLPMSRFTSHFTYRELDPDQEKLLEQGECDAGEVAMFVVGKVLADETAMLFHLHEALLAEFRSRHRLREASRRSRPVPIRRRSSDTDMVALFPRSSGRRNGGGATAAPPAAAADDDSINNNRCRLDSSSDHQGGFFACTPGLEKTFSFVEEVEIVAGEGSDTPGFGDGGDGDGDEDGGSSADGSGSVGRRAGQWDGAGRSGVTALSSTRTSPARAAVAVAAAATKTSTGRRASGVTSAAAAAAAAAAVSKDAWRTNSSRLDSWVQLDGTACSSCGGRMANGNPQNGRRARPAARDVDEDEGGLGEGWASAEAPACWCRDEGGLSASPEDVPMGMLAHARAGRDTASSHVSEDAVPASSVEVGAADRGGQGDLKQQQNGRRTNGAGVTASGGNGDDERGRGGAEGGVGGGGEGAEDTFDALRDVHGVLRELTRAVLEWCPLLTASHEAQIQAVNCIDQRVFLETYGPVFGRIASSGTAREGDASLSRRVRREERSRAASGRPSLLSTCRGEVMSALRAAGAARTGRDKLGFLVRAVEDASDALPEQPTTDALIFSVCRHLAAATWDPSSGGGGIGRGGGDVDAEGDGLAVGGGEAAEGSGGGGGGGGGGDAQPSAALPRPHAEVAFVEQFMRDESWVMGKEGYVLTTVIAALHVLSDKQMSDDVFMDSPPTA